MTEPGIIYIFLALLIGSCIVSCVTNYVKERIGAVKLVVLKTSFVPFANSDDNELRV